MSRPNAEPNNKSDILSVHLSEFESSWREVVARFDNQRQAFNYLITLGSRVAKHLIRGAKLLTCNS
jgi:hypothetical protein